MPVVKFLCPNRQILIRPVDATAAGAWFNDAGLAGSFVEMREEDTGTDTARTPNLRRLSEDEVLGMFDHPAERHPLLF